MKPWTKLLAILLCLSLLLPLLPAPARAEDAGEEEEDDFTVISLGDSFASGEGNPPYYGQDADMKYKRNDPSYMGHQSEDNWAGQLTVPGIEGTLAENRGAYWHFAASSGATTENIKRTGSTVPDEPWRKEGEQTKEYSREWYSGNYNVPGQLDVIYNNPEVDRNKIKYVTLSIGGNDVDFEGIIKKAALKSSAVSSSLHDAIDEKLNQFFDPGSTYEKLYDTYHRIAEAAPNATIIVTGYPELLDPKGSNAFFNEDEANEINQAVLIFNKYLNGIVNKCKREGVKIEFVDVAPAFHGHGANSSDPYIHKVILGAGEQELDSWALTSAGSIHPNRKGMSVYAKLVQQKIDELELKNDPNREVSEKQNIVLVLDNSGSMEGAPIRQTRSAAQDFIDKILQEDASIGVVTFESSARLCSNFSKNAASLKSIVEGIRPAGRTNTEAGLRIADSLLSGVEKGKKIIVLMSDGLTNEGLMGAELTAYIESLKAKGIYFYTMGFFEDLYGSELNQGQSFMEDSASPGCHYEVEDADDLVGFFNDIADQVNGQEYSYFRIACPVDVEVTYGDETLSSVTGSTRTSFGTLTFEAGEDDSYSRDNRTKILRLREDGREYQIRIRGNGEGTMHFTAGFMDENGEYTDLREIKDVPITPRTYIEANTDRDDETTLRVDTDGDGDFDETYSEGGPPFRWWILVLIGAGLAAAAVVISVLLRRKKQPKGEKPMAPTISALEAASATAAAPAVPQRPAPAPAAKPAAPQRPAAAPAGDPSLQQLRSSDVVVCPSCGARHDGTSKFCGVCGAPLPQKKPADFKFCGSCGAKVSRNAVFCPNCGFRF